MCSTRRNRDETYIKHIAIDTCSHDSCSRKGTDPMTPAAIKDEFAKLKNRPARYRLRHMKAGLCIHCPKPMVTDLRCRECADRHNLVVKKLNTRNSNVG